MTRPLPAAEILADLRAAAILLALLTLVTGGLYPLAVTAIARVAFPHAAAGSLIDATGSPVAAGHGAAAGSSLIGQPFAAPRHFWGRLSATAPLPGNAAASGGSNLGPLNPALVAAARTRLEALMASTATAAAVPVDLVTASASGLDPHVSPAAAECQVPRVAAARGMSEDAVREFVRRHTLGRQWGLLGEPRVNVLTLNLDLDAPR